MVSDVRKIHCCDNVDRVVVPRNLPEFVDWGRVLFVKLAQSERTMKLRDLEYDLVEQHLAYLVESNDDYLIYLVMQADLIWIRLVVMARPCNKFEKKNYLVKSNQKKYKSKSITNLSNGMRLVVLKI